MHDPYCQEGNCPDCAYRALRIMLADRAAQRANTRLILASYRQQHSRTTMTRAQRNATRYRPMGVR